MDGSQRAGAAEKFEGEWAGLDDVTGTATKSKPRAAAATPSGPTGLTPRIVQHDSLKTFGRPMVPMLMGDEGRLDVGSTIRDRSSS